MHRARMSIRKVQRRLSLAKVHQSHTHSLSHEGKKISRGCHSTLFTSQK